MNKQVVILGAGQGGLSAAVYSRLRGLDVVVLERGDKVGGKAAEVRIGDYRLDPGPSIIILTRIYAAVFADAGRRMEDYLRFDRLDPISRVAFEGREWFDLPANRSDCEALVSQIEPSDGIAFAAMMDRLDRAAGHIDKSIFAHPYDRAWQLADPHLIAFAMNLNSSATYKESVDRLFRSPLLRAFFYGFPSYGGETYDGRALGALLIPYFMLQEGVYYPKGGVAAIPQAFRRLAEELGVEFRTGADVAGLTIRSGRVREAKLTTGETIRGDAFISNVDRSTTRSWLGHEDTRQPNLSYFTLHVGIRRRFPQIGHHMLLIPADYETAFDDLYRRRRFPERPIIYLNSPAVADPTAAPENATNLLAVVTSPAMEDRLDWDRESAGYRARVLSQLQRFGIEFVSEDLDFERVQTPATFQTVHGNFRGSLYGVDAAHRLFGGTFPLRNRDEDYPNLFYCGASVQPGAGLPMVTLSGKFAAQLV